MPEVLKVIALVSGGKDSFFSILHCLANGHEIVALANLHPQPDEHQVTKNGPSILINPDDITEQTETVQPNEIDDIESHMYQTIGHEVIPLYALALNIPIYRQPIRGNAVSKAKTYQLASDSSAIILPTLGSNQGHREHQTNASSADQASMQDETESLVPLLQRIKANHPEANALSSGAILSTYQRTRIESVAIRLDLVPLAYLWQYPSLPPYTQSSLLQDMRAVGMDARIVKVASGGLDASMLWENVADQDVIRRLARAMQRYAGSEGVQVGAIVGEGGEFETLVLDGPEALFARRIFVEDSARQIVIGQGGTASIRVQKASVVEKYDDERGRHDYGTDIQELRRPNLWDDEFKYLLRSLEDEGHNEEEVESLPAVTDFQSSKRSQLSSKSSPSEDPNVVPTTISMTASSIYLSNMIAPPPRLSNSTCGAQATTIITRLRANLSSQNLTPADISFTTILLRSMASFAEVNEAYSMLFHLPNPPARVTVAVGESLPPGVDVMMSFIAERRLGVQSRESEESSNHQMEALHVQSRSYWAPANIGPYSQAVAVAAVPWQRYTPNYNVGEEDEEDAAEKEEVDVVHCAGQIPLVPASMTLLVSADFREHAALSLQHLWRVGRAMNVRWWGGGAVAFLTAQNAAEARYRAVLAGKIWLGMHKFSQAGEESDYDDEGMDVGDAALYRPWASNADSFGSRINGDSDRTHRSLLPDWGFVGKSASQSVLRDVRCAPPFFAIEISELPRGAQVEWWSFGFAGKRWKLQEDLNGHHMTNAAGNVSISWRGCMTMEDLRDFLDETKMYEQRDANKDGSGFLEIFSPHALAEGMVTKTRAMFIPCKSVWDSAGQSLFAAVRERWYKTDKTR